MASNFIEIEKALIVAVETVDSTTPTSFPNNELVNKPDGLWLKVSNLHSETTPVTMGDGGEDNHRGILQIDINYPANKGSGASLGKADEFSDYFKAGKALLYNAQCVKIISCSLNPANPARYVGGYYRLTLSINYYARTTR